MSIHQWCIPLIVYTCGPGAPLLHWGTEWNHYTLLCKHTSVCVCVSKNPGGKPDPNLPFILPHEEAADLPLSLPHFSLSLHLLSILHDLPHLCLPSQFFSLFLCFLVLFISLRIDAKPGLVSSLPPVYVSVNQHYTSFRVCISLVLKGGTSRFLHKHLGGMQKICSEHVWFFSAFVTQV